MATSANCRLVARLPRTAFKKGESGNPRGRSAGTRNRTTVEVREMATRLIDDPEYLHRLRERLRAGTAGAVEIMLWHYAFGRPPDRVETGAPNAFAALSDANLRERLAEALAALDDRNSKCLPGL
jgi:hypothetical protein